MVLNGSRPSSRSGARLLAARWGKEGGHHRIQLCLVPRRDGVGAMGTKRRRVGGVGTFTGGGAVFYRAKVRPGRPGAFNGRR
jgi:hypothetical protein